MKRLIMTLLMLQFSTILSAQNLLNGPDHVEYDAINDRYLVTSSANFAIVAIDNEGVQSYFKSGLGAYLFGLHISSDTVYVGDSAGRVRALDLNSANILWTLTLSGAHYMSGMAIDNSGYLYAVDNNGYNSKIWKINPADQSYELYIGSGLPGFPTDIAYDEPNNRLLLISYDENSAILAIDLDDASLTSVVTPPAFNRVGIIMDNDRNVYFTSMYGCKVYKYDQTFTNPPILVAETYGTILGSGPGYNSIDNILAIPIFSDNSVVLVPLADSDNDAVIDITDNCPQIPNFNQLDSDNDGDGDVCDGCPFNYNPGHEDSDADGIEDACDNCPENYNPGQEDSNGNNVGDLCDYVCGDIDGTPGINILDIVFLINRIYKSGPDPNPLESADVNHDLVINILDIVYLINYVYKGGVGPECVVWG